MADRDVVIAKIAAIEHGLRRIADVRERRTQLTDTDYQDLVELNLQRAAQDAIDLAAHVVASARWAVVDDMARNFSVLRENGVIDADLERRLRGMVGFRNIAVHQYVDVDPEVVEDIVSNHLGDLRALARAIVRWLEA